MNLRKVDYLEWLGDQEEWVLFEIEYPDFCDLDVLKRELQLIRELKAIVTAYEGQDEPN